jgi:pimeloyl-ACP methyl ester carboxylesterase
MQGQIAKNHHFISFDLPGHGQSSNAEDPKRSYTRPGLADAAIELLDKLGVAEAIVFGWSLGGHIGVEMMTRFPGMRGLMISGPSLKSVYEIEPRPAFQRRIRPCGSRSTGLACLRAERFCS